MARTQQEIFDELITAKDADSVLSTILTSNSKASFYQSLFWLYAFFASLLEQTFDAFTEDIQENIDSKQVHTSFWWRKISLAFQLGDALTIFDNGNLGYSVEDEDKQIVERAAVLSPDDGAITLKVAKLSGSDPVPLGTSELSAFESYINDMQPAGLSVTVVSVNGDEIQIALAVEIDSQVINVDDGTLLSDGATKPVEAAIYEYFGGFQDTAFGGTFYASQLLSTILSASGVVNATFSLLEKKAANEGVFTDVLLLSGKSFLTFSGYVRIADGFDLSANITYTAV